ncbi:GntR family transcriptional regulator [Yangia mangrovi]|uniref:GntR family transcriptional regulator n=1 Tax=Alloyangia mangrovi TaxID=1779329 RepID=A0ABT2KT07_9RHOB|nr:GntR family transcriptional regulator [Alloyangia mangrovi]
MTSRQAQLDEALARIADAIDHDSSVGVPQQLRGALEFGIASGELPIGARLPSVRALARQLNLSPVTVSNVYAALQSAGHVEGRVGSGTFVSPNAPVADPEKFHALERAIANLISLARDCGIDRADLATRIGMDRPRNTRAVRVLMLGNFAEATRAYAADVRPHLAPGDSIEPMLIDEVADAPPQDFDIVLSPRTLLPQARALFPQAEVVGLTVIPNEATRVALAAIPPRGHGGRLFLLPHLRVDDEGQRDALRAASEPADHGGARRRERIRPRPDRRRGRADLRHRGGLPRGTAGPGSKRLRVSPHPRQPGAAQRPAAAARPLPPPRAAGIGRVSRSPGTWGGRRF